MQLDLTIGADLNAPAIERELLRVILMEMMYRRQPNLPVGTAYVRPPEWLVDGILAWGSQVGPAEFGAPLKNPIGAHKIISLENFLFANDRSCSIRLRVKFIAHILMRSFRC